ncbi:MAG: hypothetical protein ACXABY_35020, partial [Candidatus Thorarchaeota archaeon]
MRQTIDICRMICTRVEMAMRIAQLKKLEQNGALRLLVLIAERDRFITELLKSSVNPSGIISL